jgi:hypothetical protein
MIGAFDTGDISDMDANTASSPIDIGVRSRNNDFSMIGQSADTATGQGDYIYMYIYIYIYIYICIYMYV